MTTVWFVCSDSIEYDICQIPLREIRGNVVGHGSLTHLALSYGNTWLCLTLSHSYNAVRALSSGPIKCVYGEIRAIYICFVTFYPKGIYKFYAKIVLLNL